MEIRFKIHYNTKPGQRIAICGSTTKLGKWDISNAKEMHYLGGGYWESSISYKGSQTLEYKYLLLDEYSDPVWEQGPDRLIDVKSLKKDLVIAEDQWSWPSKEERALYSDAFSKVIMQAGRELKGKKSNAKKTFKFRIKVPRITKEFQLCVIGNQKILGNWDVNTPLLLECGENFPTWQASVDLSKLKFPVQYKYGIYDTIKQKVVTFEEGNDRILYKPKIENDSFEIIKSDENFTFPLGKWKGAGVSVPVFSLRSEKSFGVGEFNDLIPFIDWAKEAGMQMVQILPVNETIAYHNWLDSYPYKSISITALHPIFLNLEKIGIPEDKESVLEFQKQQALLNKEESVLYNDVMRWKSKYYKIIFDQEKKTFFKSTSFKVFYKNNKEWLQAYAAFAYLRDKHKTPDFRNWGAYSKFSQQKIDKLCDPGSENWDDISIHYFIQYHLDKQLLEASNHARKSGVVLKGDIPIGISPNSVEAWTEPHLFHLNGQAGAPPDDFAIKGQNWGFPTYNWERMKKDGYEWWVNRLQKMASYFDAYRIDHILGFFRIWEIPQHAVEGIMGYFNPALPLSTEEIRQYGIQFEYERMVEPYINYRLLIDLFQDHSEEVIKQYLEEVGFERYRLKNEFNTQKKVNQFFLNGIEEEGLDLKRRQIRNGLFDLISNVLFIQMGDDQWHPRVNMHSTHSYKDLAPYQKHGLDRLYNEFFYNRHNDFWYAKGMEKLPAIIKASNMLVCGEDLGMVPDCVPPVMDQMNILSLEIQRMPKDPKKKFAHPSDAPYLSVCTSSTHDMPTIRGWWEKDREAIQDFFINELGNQGEAPYYAEPWICQQILTQHLYSRAMWTTFPIQDLMAIDGSLRWEATHKEQINDPSNVRHKWKYRMHLKIEELQKATGFNQLLKMLITESGRNSSY